ncbi:MAG: peroxiredoxin family protein [bacterium]
MKRAFGCLFVLIFLCIIGYIIYEKRDDIKDFIETYSKQPDEKPEPEREAKPSEQEEITTEYDFSLTSINGKTYSLSDFKGKVVLIDFWATWCPPCRKAIPSIVEIFNTYKERGLVILGISCDQGPEEFIIEDLKKFISEYDISYPILLGTEEVKKKYKIEAIPTIFLFDRKGKLVHKEVGFTEEKMAELRKMIELLLYSDVQVNYFGQILSYKRISGIEDFNLQNADECYDLSYSQISDEFLSSLHSTFDKLNIADNPFAQMLFLIEFFSSFTSYEGPGYYSMVEILSNGISNTLSNAIATVAIMRKLGWDILCFYNMAECYIGIHFTEDWHITKKTSIVTAGKEYILKDFDTTTPAGQLKINDLTRRLWHIHFGDEEVKPIPVVKDLPKIQGNTIDRSIRWRYIDEEYGFSISIPLEQIHFADNLPSSVFGMAISGVGELENLGIIEHLYSLIREKDEYNQVNFLLKFCQSENIFMYDSGAEIRSISRQLMDGKNDCDGRSVVLYSLLVGVLNYTSDDVVFLHWPFHYAIGLKPKTSEAESTLIANGASSYAGYYVLDPTYTGDTFWGDKMPHLSDKCEVIKYPAQINTDSDNYDEY